jgi:hypothetical protein
MGRVGAKNRPAQPESIGRADGGGRGRGTVGDGLPGSREAEGEGGEGYIAQSARCPDLLVIGA